VRERETCAQPTQHPTEAAGVVTDPCDVAGCPLGRGEGMMNKPKGTRADFEIVGVLAVVHAIAGRQRFVYERENQVLSVQGTCFERSIGCSELFIVFFGEAHEWVPIASMDANERKRRRSRLSRWKTARFVRASTGLQNLRDAVGKCHTLYLNAFEQVIAWHLAWIKP
jgi:hypothetical protein